MARKVVLAGACRTAIGVMGGQFANTSAVELGTIVIKEALKRAGVSPDQVDEVYMGNVIQAGNGQNPARQAAVYAGIPNEVPATTINVLCGSGLHCVNLAAKLIAAGDADIIVAGGMENMTMAPYMLRNGRYGYRMGNATIEDAMIKDGLTDAFHNYHMGITAENICEQVLINMRSRENADKSRLNLKKKLSGNLDITNRVAKFVDCRSKDTEQRELFIVEGDSALGACKQARTPDFQANKPIRGKILNCLQPD